VFVVGVGRVTFYLLPVDATATTGQANRVRAPLHRAARELANTAYSIRTALECATEDTEETSHFYLSW